MNLLLAVFIVVLLSYSLAFLNSTVLVINISQSIVGRVSIQPVFAQQDNSTIDEDVVDEDVVDDKNARPVADDKNVGTDQDESVDIQLTGSDEDDGDEVTFSLKTYPKHGNLNGVDDTSWEVIADGNVVTYDPDKGYYGEDSFSVRPYDDKSSGRIGYVSIEVNPDSSNDGQRPKAYAGQDQTVRSTYQVTLDGRGSSDPDCGLSIIGENQHCGILSYEWERKDNGPDLEGLEVSELTEDKLTFDAPVVENTEILSFQLIVSDGIDGSSDPNTVDITVEPPEGNAIDPEPPIADAGQDQIVSREGSVQLDGTGSRDPDGDEIWPVSWRQIAGNPSVELSDNDIFKPTFPAPSVEDEEVLSFELIVSDGTYNSDPSTVDITIGPPEENDWTFLMLLSGITVALIGTAYMIKKLAHHHTIDVRTRGKIEYY